MKRFRRLARMYALLLTAEAVALLIYWLVQPYLLLDRQRPDDALLYLAVIGVVMALYLLPLAIVESRRKR